MWRMTHTHLPLNINSTGFQLVSLCLNTENVHTEANINFGPLHVGQWVTQMMTYCQNPQRNCKI